jgi:ATP:ADP antiporter, AAA family
LTVALLIVASFPALPDDGTQRATAREDEVIGGGALAGMTHVLKSPYLTGIAVFILLYTLGSTVLYFAQTDIIGQFYEDREARTAVLGKMEFVTQSLTAFGQLFLTGRLLQRFGLHITLAAVPFVSLLGFAALGLANAGLLPLLATFIGFSVARRSIEFILTNPSRKVLFTVLSREDKYKASSFIETFVYRAGDQLASWGYAGLVALGLTLTGISWVTVAFAGLFVWVAVWLGKRHRVLAERGG